MITTFPGDIPGLLRRGSPVIYAGRRCILVDVGALLCAVAVTGPTGRVSIEAVGPSSLALDLTTPTGRIHLLWWIEAQAGPWPREVPLHLIERVIELVRDGADLTPEQIATLRELGLRFAGRWP